jgi:TetR/AcrR family transcriptional regulator, transcriptional repressor for nem operon
MKKQFESTAEWPETKRRLVDAGIGLMRTNGFNATSLDDICQAAGVTKGGFFHYFKSKDEVAKAAVTEFTQERARIFREAPFRRLADPLERVLGRLDFAIESARAGRLTKGCLIGTLAQELAFTHPDMRSICRESLQQVAEDFEKDLSEAKAAYAPKASFEPKKLASLYVAATQGSLILAKTSESNKVTADNLAQLRDFIELLFASARVSSDKKSAKSAGADRN